MGFNGFRAAALDFYDDLEVDNTRSFWEAHKAVYAEEVRAPMTALCAALAAEFGDATLFRPYRDVRFARDKSPYKTHQGAFVRTGPATGWYVQLSARGLMTGAGFYQAEPDRLAAYRAAVDDERRGPRLAALLADLEGQGWEISGDRLKTRPRGWPADHPRLDLLRHRSLTVGRQHGFDPVIHTSQLTDVVRSDWRSARPLVEWLAEAMGGTGDG